MFTKIKILVTPNVTKIFIFTFKLTTKQNIHLYILQMFRHNKLNFDKKHIYTSV